MGTKKINPTNPAAKSANSDEKDNSVDRKSSAIRAGKRKSSAYKSGR